MKSSKGLFYIESRDEAGMVTAIYLEIIGAQWYILCTYVRPHAVLLRICDDGGGIFEQAKTKHKIPTYKNQKTHTQTQCTKMCM